MTVNSFGPSGPLKNKLPVLLAWISQVFDTVFFLFFVFSLGWTKGGGYGHDDLKKKSICEQMVPCY